MNKKQIAGIAGITATAALIINAAINPAPAQAVTISTPMTYTCNGGSIAGITVRNTHDVIVRDCNVETSSRNAVQITDSYNVLFERVNVSSSYKGGSGYNLESTTANATHDIVIQDAHIFGPMSWGIAGSNQSLLRITIRDVVIENIGAGFTVQEHGIYLNNWRDSLLEDVTILNSWNSGIKIVGTVPNLRLSRVKIANSGKNPTNTSGPGISLDSSTITELVITDCDISNSKSPAIWTLSKVNGVTIDRCKFTNNYYAIEIPSGGTGWRVTNSTGYTQLSYAYAHPPVQFDGSNSDIANNFFDLNNWYYDGANPVRAGGVSMSFAAWQTRGQDINGISALPVTGSTNTPQIPTNTATLTPTRTQIPPSVTNTPSFTVTPVFTVQISSTPSVTASPTMTRTPPPPIIPSATRPPITINGTPYYCPCNIVIP